MMKHTKWTKVLFIGILAVMLALVGCSKDSDSKDSSKKSKNAKDGLYSIQDFSPSASNKNKPIDGGEITVGLVSSSPFNGSLNFNYYDGTYDYEVIRWFDEPLFTIDEDFNFTNDGAATVESSKDHKTYTIKIKDNVNWQDGKPVTAEDYVFAHEVIGHPDYDGVRYDDTFRNIEGMEDYHSGKSEKISGIKVLDKKTVQITYKDPTPSLVAGGIWSYPLAKHIFGKMKIADISKSDAVRKNPIGYGPYKVESIVPGESVTLVKNKDYWRGEPQLDKVTVKIVDPSVIAKELQKGSVDIAALFPTDQYPDNANMSNVEYLGRVDGAYTYIGFKLGTWDKKKNEVKPNPNAKMADVKLRQAMWYAVNNDAIGEKFYHGLRWNANTLIPPYFKTYHAEDVKAPTYDKEKAKQILEEAGYKDKDGDGFREDKNGKKLVINFASMDGGDIAEPLTNYYIQAWKDVGLKVELLDGRLQEFETFYKRVGNEGNDDPKVDIYQAAWSTGTDVDPAGLYGRYSLFNYTRYTNEKNDELLKKGLSKEAFDVKYRQDVYKEWQQFMVDEIPLFPTLYRAKLEPVNKRIVNYSIKPYDGEPYLYQLGVSQDKPVTGK